MSSNSQRRLGARLTGKLTLLAASMRAAGVRVGVAELLSAHRALGEVDPTDRDAAYLALRSTLCSRREDVSAFDAAFAEWFRPAAPAEPAHETLLRDKDIADYSEPERRQAQRAIRDLAAAVPARPALRLQSPRRRGGAPVGMQADLSPWTRASRRSGADRSERHWREPGGRPRPVVVIGDVSDAMEPYAQMLLAYLQGWMTARRRVEAFVIGQQLTRVTDDLRGRELDVALERAKAVPEPPAGARLGAALAALNKEHAARGAVVVLLSDGCDGGDPGQLARELARLARRAHRLIWLNPLEAHPDYSPRTRGMQAALPFVDEFMAGNSLASLEELADALNRLSGGKEEST